MLKKLLLPVLCLISATGYSQSQKITIRTAAQEEVNYLQAKDFYLNHYLYIDLFLRENLFPEASVAEVSQVISALKSYLSPDNKLDISIERPGPHDYILRFAVVQNDRGETMLIAFTNWNHREKRFEQELKLEHDSYTRWYFLNGDKLTYRKDMSGQMDYSDLHGAALANAFLFDELADNDQEIESLLVDALEDAKEGSPDAIMAQLLFLKYYQFREEHEKATEQAKTLEQLFAQHDSQPDLRGLKMAFDATKFQMQL